MTGWTTMMLRPESKAEPTGRTLLLSLSGGTGYIGSAEEGSSSFKPDSLQSG